MDADVTNPYASPDSRGTARRRPIGVILLATLLLLLGTASGGGVATKIIPICLGTVSIPDLLQWLRFVHIGVMAIMAVVASIGLFCGRRWGWWSAIAFCYFGFASFILLAIVRAGPAELLSGRRIGIGLSFFLAWCYLQRKTVSESFGGSSASWRTHVGLFLLTVFVVLGLGMW